MKKFALILVTLSLSAGDLFGQESSVIVTSRDGACDTCRILFADSSGLILWKCSTPYTVDSAGECAVQLRPSDIDRIVIQREGHIWSGAGTGFLIGAGAGAIIGLASGDDESGLFRYTAGEKALLSGTFLGIAGGLVGGIVGGVQGMDDDYNLRGQYKRYIEVLPELKDASMLKASLPKALAEHREGFPGDSTPVPEEMDTLPEPSMSGIHISVGEGMQVLGPDADNITEAFNSSGFGGTEQGFFGPLTYPVENSNLLSANISVDFDLTDNLRLGLTWSGMARKSVDGKDRETENSGGNSYGLLFTLVPSPAAPLLASRGEFAISVGVSLNSLYVDGTLSTWTYSPSGPAPVTFHDATNAIGLMAQVSYDYYLWKHFSIQCKAWENLIPSSLNVREVRYTNPADGSTKILTAHSVDFTGFSLSIGARFHF